MFSLEPPFTIIRCDPLTTAFGGVGYSSGGAYSVSELANEIKSVVESVGESLRYAYDIRTVVERPEMNLLSTRISPVQAVVKDDTFVDMKAYKSLLERRKPGLFQKIESTCRDMAEQRKDNAILIRSDRRGFYFLHKIKESFDPESTGYLLEAMQTLMLRETPNEFMTRKEMRPDYLRVDLKLGRPKNREYVV